MRQNPPRRAHLRPQLAMEEEPLDHGGFAPHGAQKIVQRIAGPQRAPALPDHQHLRKRLDKPRVLLSLRDQNRRKPRGGEGQRESEVAQNRGEENKDGNRDCGGAKRLAETQTQSFETKLPDETLPKTAVLRALGETVEKEVEVAGRHVIPERQQQLAEIGAIFEVAKVALSEKSAEFPRERQSSRANRSKRGKNFSGRWRGRGSGMEGDWRNVETRRRRAREAWKRGVGGGRAA